MDHRDEHKHDIKAMTNPSVQDVIQVVVRAGVSTRVSSHDLTEMQM